MGGGVFRRASGGLRAGPSACEHEPHRGRPPAHGSVRAAAGARGSVERVPGRIVLPLDPALADQRSRLSSDAGAAAGSTAKAARPAYPVCVHTGTGEGTLRPPSNPRPPAPLPSNGRPGGSPRGSPRTPAPVRARRSGAPVWSPPTSPRRSRSPSTRPRRPSGSRPPVEPANAVLTGVREQAPDSRVPKEVRAAYGRSAGLRPASLHDKQRCRTATVGIRVRLLVASAGIVPGHREPRVAVQRARRFRAAKLST